MPLWWLLWSQVGAGSLKRDVMSRHPEAALSTAERDVLILSTCSTVVPKLVAQDLPIFRALLQGTDHVQALRHMEDLKACELHTQAVIGSAREEDSPEIAP